MYKIFPFVKIHDFSSVFKELRREMIEFKSFKLQFNELSYFQHGNSCVVWLKPSIPECEDIINKI
ncbi:hypothetical protein DICPUDRAFT_147953 [Dictyostelium purpureum]|uniref:Uncharacterized protein n=1 Tax=Dictyostelium purpureum TaxID=5786 RepID=F0Z9V1_DICPU|nr:uncharacterized protein DICPUDRAFT_147953 [Dictyostelium purpureum]EGC39278.1 hypothetical protein DICPUDRAFT_147953 [Dictyostelium purpureum]|eukprot:XP_003284182.1 hypothetical protein DICPUDRAFT_147953 [Dictyostelium purpureum]